MRTFYSQALQQDISSLGFGCASLGSRISAREGRRALEAAFDLGINWFDTAPPYGDGESEAILGQFLGGKRQHVMVCTKVGIARRPAPRFKALARPLFRYAIARAPNLRARIAAARPPQARAPLTAGGIISSVTDSLRRLKVSYVDVLALHEPTAAEASDPEIWEALSQAQSRGYARIVGIAGDLPSAVAGLAAFSNYGFVQLADDPFTGNLDRLSTTRPDSRRLLRATHSLFGVNAALTKLERYLRTRSRSRIADLVAESASDTTEMAIEVLLNYAFANNPEGIVLASMYNSAHLRKNIHFATRAPDMALKAELDNILATDAGLG